MKTSLIVKIIFISSLIISSLQKEEADSIEKSTGDNKTAPTTKVPVILPESKIILPIRRIGTSASQLNMSPCGGVERLKADTLTNKGSNLHFIWETVLPAKGSNCTVKISKGLEKEDEFSALPLLAKDIEELSRLSSYLDRKIRLINEVDK